jgi:hypothetical protein
MIIKVNRHRAITRLSGVTSIWRLYRCVQQINITSGLLTVAENKFGECSSLLEAGCSCMYEIAQEMSSSFPLNSQWLISIHENLVVCNFITFRVLVKDRKIWLHPPVIWSRDNNEAMNKWLQSYITDTSACSIVIELGHRMGCRSLAHTNRLNV